MAGNGWYAGYPCPPPLARPPGAASYFHPPSGPGPYGYQQPMMYMGPPGTPRHLVPPPPTWPPYPNPPAYCAPRPRPPLPPVDNQASEPQDNEMNAAEAEDPDGSVEVKQEELISYHPPPPHPALGHCGPYPYQRPAWNPAYLQPMLYRPPPMRHMGPRGFYRPPVQATFSGPFVPSTSYIAQHAPTSAGLTPGELLPEDAQGSERGTKRKNLRKRGASEKRLQTSILDWTGRADSPDSPEASESSGGTSDDDEDDEELERLVDLELEADEHRYQGSLENAAWNLPPSPPPPTGAAQWEASGEEGPTGPIPRPFLVLPLPVHDIPPRNPVVACQGLPTASSEESVLKSDSDESTTENNKSSIKHRCRACVNVFPTIETFAEHILTPQHLATVARCAGMIREYSQDIVLLHRLRKKERKRNESRMRYEQYYRPDAPKAGEVIERRRRGPYVPPPRGPMETMDRATSPAPVGHNSYKPGSYVGLPIRPSSFIAAKYCWWCEMFFELGEMAAHLMSSLHVEKKEEVRRENLTAEKSEGSTGREIDVPDVTGNCPKELPEEMELVKEQPLTNRKRYDVRELKCAAFGRLQKQFEVHTHYERFKPVGVATVNVVEQDNEH